jgi:hypothetical protein
MGKAHAPQNLLNKTTKSGAALDLPDKRYDRILVEDLRDSEVIKDRFRGWIEKNYQKLVDKGESHISDPWLGDGCPRGQSISVRKYRLDSERLRLVRRSEQGKVDWFLAIHKRDNFFDYYYIDGIPAPSTTVALATAVPTTSLPAISNRPTLSDEEAEQIFLRSQTPQTTNANVTPISGGNMTLRLSGGGSPAPVKESWEDD